jgi:hypothetical protein
MRTLTDILDTTNEPNILQTIEWGGKRKGAGRKPAPYKTKTISIRVREEWAEEVKQAAKDKIRQLTDTPRDTSP